MREREKEWPEKENDEWYYHLHQVIDGRERKKGKKKKERNRKKKWKVR